jgi:ABC-type transporter Mla MlaB component
MLRITRVHGRHTAPTLRLEGKLLGPWVAELARACAELPCSSSPLRLDLSAVTFVDDPGVQLLRDLLGRGVTLAACSGLVAELLHGEGRR